MRQRKESKFREKYQFWLWIKSFTIKGVNICGPFASQVQPGKQMLLQTGLCTLN